MNKQMKLKMRWFFLTIIALIFAPVAWLTIQYDIEVAPNEQRASAMPISYYSERPARSTDLFDSKLQELESHIDELERELAESESTIEKLENTNRELNNFLIELQTTKRLKQFATVSELKSWLSELEPATIIRNLYEYLDPTFNPNKCVGLAVGLSLTAYADGYLISTELVNNNTHMVGSTIIAEQIYLIDIQPTMGQYFYVYPVTWVE